MTTQYSGPPTNGFPGPPGARPPPNMMGRPPFQGPPGKGTPTFSGPPPTFNGKPMGPPPRVSGPPSMGPPSMGPPSIGPPSMGPPSMGPPSMGPPSMGPPSMGPPSMAPPSMGPPSMGPPSMGPPSMGPPPTFGGATRPPTTQMANVNLNSSEPPKAPSPASNLFSAPPSSTSNLFGSQPPTNNDSPPSAAAAQQPSPFPPPSNSSPASQPSPPNIRAPPSAGNPFGASASQHPSTNDSPFGAPEGSKPAASPFESVPASNSAPFEAPATSQPNLSPFGAPTTSQSTSNPFGAPPSSQSMPFGGLPTSQPAPGQFSAPPSSQHSPFGAPPISTAAPPTSQPTSNQFGAPPPSQSTPFGGHPSSRPSPFGAPNPNGAAPPSQPNPFGAPSPSQPNPFGAPSPSQPTPFGGPPTSQPAPGQFTAPPLSQPTPFGAPPTSSPAAPPSSQPSQTPFGGPVQPPTSRPPFGQQPMQPAGFGPPPSNGPNMGPPPTSNGPNMMPPPSNSFNTYNQAPSSHSPGLQGIQSGPQPGNQFGPPSSAPNFQLGPQSNAGPPPMMGGPPSMGPPPAMGPPSGRGRGYPGSVASSGPRRPYPSNQSYGVSAPASLTQPPMPPGPGQPVRHPAAPVIANPGASLQGQLPSVPQPGHQPTTPTGGPPKSRIDPDLMPNPLSVQKADQDQYESKQWVTTTPGVPPLVSTNVTMLDMGNCSPRFLRSSFYSIPSTKDLANQVNMPISFAIQPFAAPQPGEAPLATVDMTVLGGPLRCRRCKAYINPYVKFVDGGRKFICNLCNVDTEVPPEYFCNLDHTGRRADAAERPELSRGSYELLTTTDYCKGSVFPQAAAYVFVIDVTFASFQSGMVQALTSNITSVLNNLPKEPGQEKSPIRIGFITYNSQLHYYNLNPALTQPSMMVQADLSEVFVPMVDGFLVTLEDAQTHLKTLMDLIPTLHSADKKGESLFVPAVQAGCAALKAANRPGKVIVFHSSLPTAPGPGQLKNREDKKLLNTEKEVTLLTPADTIYETVSRDCVDNGVGVDLFLFPHSYIDVASVGRVATATGGVIQRYPMFRADVDGERFIQDLAMHIAQPCVFDTVLRLRTNAGIRPVEFCGNFMMQNSTDMEIASVNPNTCVTIEIKHDDKLSEDFLAYGQAALLYTSMSGQRRLRLHNIGLPVSSSLADLFKSCDMDTIMNSLTKEFGKALLANHSYKQLKESLINRVSSSLACYRQNCAAPSQPGQLILPETLKLIPLYSHCLLRSPALLPSIDVGFDEKSNLLQRLAMMGVENSELFLYPRLYNLNTSTLGNEGLPPVVRTSYERIRESGAHLLENGLVLILWIGQNTPSKWLQEVFGVTVLDQVDPTVGNLAPFDNPTSIRIRNIIEEIRNTRRQYLRLNIVRQKDKTEHIFMQFLVEDKFDQGANYTDFLCSIHREIRNILS